MLTAVHSRNPPGQPTLRLPGRLAIHIGVGRTWNIPQDFCSYLEDASAPAFFCGATGTKFIPLLLQCCVPQGSHPLITTEKNNPKAGQLLGETPFIGVFVLPGTAREWLRVLVGGQQPRGTA